MRLTKERFIAFFKRRSITTQIPTSPTELATIWGVMRKSCDPSYTKKEFFLNLRKKGFYMYARHRGKPTAIWLSRAVRIDDEDGAYIEFLWHDGSYKGKMALAYMGFMFFVALKPNTKVWHFSRNLRFKGSTPVDDKGLYLFDANRVMGGIWQAAGEA